MDLDPKNLSIDSQNLFAYSESLFMQVLNQGIKRNEEQTQTWTTYKNRHKKVIEGLEAFPSEIGINCMVPIGKRAFMKGRLVHTNEILACLGEGYFAKYSAKQAIALCNRRIELAEEMLKNLEKERNLYELRQLIPFEYDAFGKGERTDLVEHWDEKKLEDWRESHRKREKEYHQKLAELRKQKKVEITTEEELFHRLDQLELEEELADEMNRLEDERREFYGEDLDEGEVYDESDEESNSSEDATNEALERELKKLNDIRMRKSIETSDISSGTTSQQCTAPLYENEQCTETVPEIHVDDNKKPESYDELLITANEAVAKTDDSAETKVNTKDTSELLDSDSDVKITKRKKRVSFPEIEFEENTVILKSPETQEKLCSADKDVDNDENDEEEIIRIEFTHSSEDPVIKESSGDTIESPKDIYRVFCTPKSILKKTNQKIYNHDIPPPEESSTDEEEDVGVKPSAYKTIVRDVQERKTPVPLSDSLEMHPKARPVSRFKMQRSNVKQ